MQQELHACELSNPHIKKVKQLSGNKLAVGHQLTDQRTERRGMHVLLGLDREAPGAELDDQLVSARIIASIEQTAT